MTSFFGRPPNMPEQNATWGGPPEDELGQPVAIRFVLARNEQVAVWVQDLTAYSTGFELEVTVVGREPLQHHTLPPPVLPGQDVELLFRFGIRFADGHIATAFDAPGLKSYYTTVKIKEGELGSRSAPVMLLLATTRSYRRYSMRYWVSPLPPPGPLTLACQWPAMALPVVEHDIEASAILLAAAASKGIWP